MRVGKAEKFRTLEEEVLLLQQEGKRQPLSFAEILLMLSGKGRPLILILLSLPFCLPVQIPGLSVPFGFGIAFIGLRMTFGKKIWLPKSLLDRKIPSSTLQGVTDHALGLIKKMKPWVHPRLIGLCRSPFMEKGSGLMIFMLGALLALPLPIPLSNLAAAWSIFLIAFGILEDDGLFILLGYLASSLTLAFFFVLALSVKNYFYV